MFAQKDTFKVILNSQGVNLLERRRIILIRNAAVLFVVKVGPTRNERE
jgi:hypothetical protein